MPEIFINGQPVQAEANQTVLQAALANGFYIPYFCWHKELSIAGNCRICTVQVEGRSWVEISCNMPVTEGLHVLTDSDLVREHRKATMQFITLNHPVDCGICDKAGECTLQDYHFAYNGSPSVSREPKVHATKFHDLSERILLDNERCILCSRCVRFTREISKSNALGIKNRGDVSLVRAADDSPLDADPVLRQRHRHLPGRRAAVQAVPAQGARLVPEAHAFRVPRLRARLFRQHLAPQGRMAPARAGPEAEHQHRARDAARESSGQRPVDLQQGPRSGADIRASARRPRDAEGQAGRVGSRPSLAARKLIAEAKHPVALVSNWGSNEELAACHAMLNGRFATFVKHDHAPQPGERLEDDLLIRPDKNPNTAGARAVFGESALREPAFPAGTDLVLVWGEGCNFATLPAGAKIIFLNSYLQPENGHADVFIPISIQTERAGTYTNFAGVVTGFEQCFPRKSTVADAQDVFAAIVPGAAARP